MQQKKAGLFNQNPKDACELLEVPIPLSYALHRMVRLVKPRLTRPTDFGLS